MDVLCGHALLHEEVGHIAHMLPIHAEDQSAVTLSLAVITPCLEQGAVTLWGIDRLFELVGRKVSSPHFNRTEVGAG